MAVDDAFGQFELLLQEYIDPAVHNLELDSPVDVMWDFLPTFRPISTAGRRTNQAGVSDANTAGYEAQWRIRLQRGGRVTGGSMSGNTITKMGPQSALVMGQAMDGTYLDPTKTPMRSWLDLKMNLKRLRGSLTINRTQIHNDILANGLESVAVDNTEDAVYKVRKMLSSLMWSPADGIMGRLWTGTPTSITEAAVSWHPVTEGTIFRFVVGDRYVFALSDSGATTPVIPGTSIWTPRASATPLHTPSVARCVGLDPDAMYVGFQMEPGEGTLTVAKGDYVLAEGMYDFVPGGTFTVGGSAPGVSPVVQSFAPNSVQNLLIASGTYPGTAYAVTTVRELKSFVTDNTSTPVLPTPELFAKQIDKMILAGIPAPPALIAEPGIWTLYSQLERRAGAMYTVPQGSQFTASGGVDAPIIAHGDMVFRRLSSSICPPNTVTGIDPSTFCKFMPVGGGTPTIRWAIQQGGVAGVSGIFRPVAVGAILTDLSVADFDLYFQLGQTNPRRCFRMLGVHNQTTAEA